MDQKKLAIGALVLIVVLFFVATGLGIANHGESKDSTADSFEPPKWLTGVGSMNPFGEKLDTDRLQGRFRGQSELRLDQGLTRVGIGPHQKRGKKKKYLSVALELQTGAGRVAYVEDGADPEFVALQRGEPVKLAVSSGGGEILFQIGSGQGATVRLK